MNKLSLYAFFITVILLSCIKVYGQENFASNIKTEISGNEKMLITYDIEAKDGGRYFNVIIVLTHNGQQVKPNSAYGDYGSKIEAGEEKAIVWYYSNDFEGDINKVEVEVFAYKENEPQAVFRLQLIGNNGYAPCEVTFTNTSTHANEYKWDFGDPASGIRNHSFDKEPKHTYEKGGLYHITLVASNTDLGMESTFYYSLEVLEHPPTVADFEYSVKGIEAPFEVSFNELSTNADSFIWDFGDPGSGRKNSSTAINPKHKYRTAGTYNVTLTASNSTTGLSNTATKELIFKEPELPAANFIFTLSSEIAPSIVVFKNTSTNADSYSWNFGDPSSGNENETTNSNPTHTFTEPGVYEVKLTAINSLTGRSTYISQEIAILEPPKAPVAKFIIENNNVIAPATIIFKNSSDYADDYTWEFGDSGSGSANTSKVENPTHTYTSAGRYQVTLRSYSSAADKSDTFSDYVIVVEPAKPPVAAFSVDGDMQTAPAVVSFRNSSANAERFAWDFGDPDSGDDNTSLEENPSHNYSAPGRYKVVLIASNTKTGDTSTHSLFITINEPIKLPVAKFTIDGGELVSPASVSFSNSSQHSESYSWDFGDPASGSKNTSTLKDPTHTYMRSGTYKVVLTSKNSKTSEVSTHIEYVIVSEPAKLPVAGFTIDVSETVAPALIRFSSTSQNANSYSWDFGDPASGSENTSVLENPTHSYAKGGSYKVVLTITGSETNETSTHFEYVTVTNPLIIPEPAFDFDAGEAVAPATVAFINKSSKADSYSWIFGDPESGQDNMSSESNPTHTYNTDGRFEVILTAKNNSSGEERKASKYITISKPVLPPVADFSYTIEGDVAPVEVSFSNSSENGDIYAWNFGDSDNSNNTSSERNPKHVYNNPGSFMVNLTVTNSETGKSDVLSKEIKVVSEYVTFVKVLGEAGREEIATSIVETSNGQLMVVVNDTASGSKVLSISQEGAIVSEKEVGAQVFDIAVNGEAFVLGGYQDPGQLTIQNMTQDMEIDDPVLIEGISSLNRDFSTPKISVSDNKEIGVLGNRIESGEAVDMWFQKLDINGEPVPVKGMTFKFMGIKLGNEMIPSQDGGFAITGYWQEDKEKPKRLMFATVDINGKGYLKAITAVTNFIGCDIVASHTGGYGILSAQGSPMDESMYNVVLMIVGLDGGPSSFSGILHGDLKLEDMQKYPPCLIQTEGGYVIASYSFNGTDNDINLIWVDVSGEMIMKEEVIKRPGDQYVTDILKLDDGSFIIIGAEKVDGQLDALIMKTDPFGRVNPVNEE